MDDSIRCPKCGEDQFQVFSKPKLEDETTCNGCGARFTVKDLVVGPAMKKAEKEIENVLRRSGLKFTKTRG